MKSQLGPRKRSHEQVCSAEQAQILVPRNANGASCGEGAGRREPTMERIWVGIDEPEDALLSSEDTICIATVADLARDEGGCSKFVVDEKIWSMEVADAECSAKQARHERDEEESNRTAELGTSQVSAKKVCDDTQKKIGAGGCDVGFTGQGQHQGPRKSGAAQNSMKGAEERNQDGSRSRRTSPHRNTSKRWDWRSDEKTYNKRSTKLSKATAHVVRYGPVEQTWYDQQEIVEQFNKKHHKKRV